MIRHVSFLAMVCKASDPRQVWSTSLAHQNCIMNWRVVDLALNQSQTLEKNICRSRSVPSVADCLFATICPNMSLISCFLDLRNHGMFFHLFVATFYGISSAKTRVCISLPLKPWITRSRRGVNVTVFFTRQKDHGTKSKRLSSIPKPQRFPTNQGVFRGTNEQTLQKSWIPFHYAGLFTRDL